jgi:hypothetical protein
MALCRRFLAEEFRLGPGFLFHLASRTLLPVAYLVFHGQIARNVNLTDFGNLTGILSISSHFVNLLVTMGLMYLVST